MTSLPALPIVVLLVGAALCLVFLRSYRIQRLLAVVSTIALLAVAFTLVWSVWKDGPLLMEVGAWPRAFAISFYADMFGAVMVLVSALLGLMVTVYSIADVPKRHAAHGLYPLILLLLLGVCGAFLTADLFNLYVWFEVMLIASFVLLALGGEKEQLRGAVVYVTLNLLSSTLFLIAVGLLYGLARTLDYGELRERLVELSSVRPYLVGAIEAALLCAFGLKASVFPLFFWLPASYHTPSPAISALFAGLLTKVGVYALFRVTLGVFPSAAPVFGVLTLVAIATMLTGVLGAFSQTNIRRILSFHIVSQIGYMIAALALASSANPARSFAAAAAIFYIVHHILVKANLFLVAGIVRRTRGSEELADLSGIAKVHPWLGGVFLISALSLAGLPPLSGFWAKLTVIQAGLGEGAYVLVAAAILTGIITLLSMLKIWSRAMAGSPQNRLAKAAPSRREIALLGIPCVGLAALTLFIGLYPSSLFEIAARAAEDLLSPGSLTHLRSAR